MHELAHVRRRDVLVQLGAEGARALHWLDPLVWIALRELQVERERACDDAVLQAGARPSGYAAFLLSFARRRGQGARALRRARHAGLPRAAGRLASGARLPAPAQEEAPLSGYAAARVSAAPPALAGRTRYGKRSFSALIGASKKRQERADTTSVKSA